MLGLALEAPGWDLLAEHSESGISVGTWSGERPERGNRGDSQDPATPLLHRKLEEEGSRGFGVLGAVPCLCHLSSPTEGHQPCSALGGSRLFPGAELLAGDLSPVVWSSEDAERHLKPLLGLPGPSCAPGRQDLPSLCSGTGRSPPGWLLEQLPGVEQEGHGAFPREVQLLQLGGTEEASKGKAGFDGRPGWCSEVPTRTQNGKEEVRNHLGWAGQEGWARDVTQSWL